MYVGRLRSRAGTSSSANEGARPAKVAEKRKWANYANEGPEVLSVMRNQLVLERISKRLPNRVLLSLRETHSSWNQIFKAEHAEKHDPIQLYVDPLNSYEGVHFMADYCNAMGPPHSSGNSNMFSAFIIQDLGLGRLQDVTCFFSLFGASIKRLELNIDKLDSSAILTVRRIVFEWAEKLEELTIFAIRTDKRGDNNKKEPSRLQREMPNLKKLALIEHEPFGNSASLLISDLFRNATHLSHLELAESSALDFLQLYQDCQIVRPTISCLVASSLEVEHLKLLIQLSTARLNPLQLREMKISILCAELQQEQEQGAIDEEMNSLTHSFIATQAHHLHKLEIGLMTIRFGEQGNLFTYPLRLARMEHVHTIVLERNWRWIFIVRCNEGNFESNFPKLKRLEFNFEHRVPVGGVAHVELAHIAHSRLSSLKFSAHSGDMQEDAPLASPNFSQTWPSLTHLELHARPRVFQQIMRSVWTLWPALVSLRVKVTARLRESMYILELDQLLSGIADSEQQRAELSLRAALLEPANTLDELRLLHLEFKSLPSLSDLMRLQEFRVNAGLARFGVTDIGGYFGLAMMRSPQQVSLIQTRSETTDGEEMIISEQCSGFLRSAWGPFAVIEL